MKDEEMEFKFSCPWFEIAFSGDPGYVERLIEKYEPFVSLALERMKAEIEKAEKERPLETSPAVGREAGKEPEPSQWREEKGGAAPVSLPREGRDSSRAQISSAPLPVGAEANAPLEKKERELSPPLSRRWTSWRESRKETPLSSEGGTPGGREEESGSSRALLSPVSREEQREERPVRLENPEGADSGAERGELANVIEASSSPPVAEPPHTRPWPPSTNAYNSLSSEFPLRRRVPRIRAEELTRLIEEKKPRTHHDRVMVFGYYMEGEGGGSDFTTAEIKRCYRAVGQDAGTNIEQVINHATRSGFVTRFDQGRTTRFKLSSKGRRYVEDGLRLT